ncbi:MarR family winged helix-turn-helix transcriptional regulator [Amycolatopsis cynarae]|uniref:MarR family winged helix-turn-helix transcriptional regulator n=1 Tax=Amycolatopsis cynarae TaxID=2995223 RepID=A0ABY7B8B6_9PSEU|nr:MarR family winged helix-turn-helix transcriptional regulator [Amycolatopsis sp. HUAS 11-8]WAL68195.1 MarR family winged helix-turn-helix transcriptional regulator [Amycolatopsis sp. HUAS 11-8]
MDAVERIERAMVAIRRRQSRRALARQMPGDPAVFAVLDAVEASGPSSVTEIAAAVGVDQPRASRLVARAVEEGLLARQADQHDGRRSVLRLTAAGRRQLDAGHAARRQAFAAAMADWPAADRTTFARLLTAFVEALDASESP